MNDNKDIHQYNDIINLPHHQSATRPHMSIHDRAAQFAPFAALVGYDDAVKETARLTDERITLSDNALEILNTKLNYIKEHISEQPVVTVTYFQADEHKTGGEYITYTGNLWKIKDYEHIIVFQDCKEVFIDDIMEIESPMFSEY